ncbi:TlpA family protein disulfide reductase [Nocardioides pyridinolyticus]
MRRVVPAALVAALLLLSGCTDDPAASPGESTVDVDTAQLRALKSETAVEECVPGDATDGGLPDLTLPCLGGGPDVDLAGLQGPLVVNLWASWCGPCKKEMPALQDFYERYGDRVGVLGVDYQDVQPDAAIELAGRLGVTYPLVADPGGDLNAEDPLPVIRGVPWLIFLDADGDVEVVPGGVEDTAELVELANEHLGTDL